MLTLHSMDYFWPTKGHWLGQCASCSSPRGQALSHHNLLLLGFYLIICFGAALLPHGQIILLSVIAALLLLHNQHTLTCPCLTVPMNVLKPCLGCVESPHNDGWALPSGHLPFGQSGLLSWDHVVWKCRFHVQRTMNLHNDRWAFPSDYSSRGLLLRDRKISRGCHFHAHMTRKYVQQDQDHRLSRMVGRERFPTIVVKGGDRRGWWEYY